MSNSEGRAQYLVGQFTILFAARMADSKHVAVRVNQLSASRQNLAQA